MNTTPVGGVDDVVPTVIDTAAEVALRLPVLLRHCRQGVGARRDIGPRERVRRRSHGRQTHGAKKISIRASPPWGSVAFALSVIVAGAVKLAPDVGEVSATVGGLFGPLTVTVTAAEVACVPAASNAFAVSV